MKLSFLRQKMPYSSQVARMCTCKCTFLNEGGRSVDTRRKVSRTTTAEGDVKTLATPMLQMINMQVQACWSNS